MRKLVLSIMRGRSGRLFALGLIGIARRVSDMPNAMAQMLMESAADPGRRVEAVGIAAWAIRHQFKVGHLKTTVNPLEYCTTLENARYCVEMIESSSKVDISEISLDTLLSIKQFLTDSDQLDRHGSKLERSAVIDKINTVSLKYLQQPDRQMNVSLKRSLYELEGRSAGSPEVRDLVSKSLQESIQERLLVLDQQRVDARAPVDIVTTINFQLTAERLGFKLFVCGTSLLALARDGALYRRKRAVNLGVVADTDEFLRLRQWAAQSVEYQLVDGPDHDDVITLEFDIGTKIVIWRHQKSGGYLIRRDGIHLWYNQYFDIGEFPLGNLHFNVPENFEQYLIESYGHDWHVPKLFDLGTFNQGNIGLDRTQNSLEHVTNAAVTGLSKSNRLRVTYAFEDLADYFGLDYMPYLPVEDFYVETPEGRKRQAEQAERLVSDTAYVLCAGAQSPDAAQLVALANLRSRHARLIAVVCPVRALGASVQSTIFKSLKAVDDVCELDALDAQTFAKEASQRPQLYNFDLQADDLKALPQGLPAVRELGDTVREGA